MEHFGKISGINLSCLISRISLWDLLETRARNFELSILSFLEKPAPFPVYIGNYIRDSNRLRGLYSIIYLICLSGNPKPLQI